jgi:phospholipid/cholesterol/gamma-HCH transport system substrate-binding protein/paraquat-inducible protein B
MEDKQRYIRLGLFVTVTLTILAGILFVLGGRSLFQPTLIVETYFDQSVAGLEVGAPVKFRGVPVGQISEISTSGPEYEQDVPVDQRKAYIVVRAKLASDAGQIAQWRKEIPDYIKRGLRAQTQLAGITGQQYLALDYMDPRKYPPLEPGWTPDYIYVPSAPSLAGQIIGNIQQFLGSLNAVDIKDLGKNLNTLAVTINRKVDGLPVGDLSTDALALLKDLHATIQRVDQVIAAAPIDRAVDKIASAAGRIDVLLADPDIGATVESTAAFTGRLREMAEGGELDRIAKHLDQAVRRIDALVGDNQYDVRTIVQDLRATADNLRSLSETAKQYPAGIFIGGPPEKTEVPWSTRK